MPRLAHFRARHDPAVPPSGQAAILHVDMDAFFVSVELLKRPELRGQPVVVGGQPNRRGVVSAASYEARQYGIHSAMPLRTAGRLCPHAVFLEGRHDLYAAWSDRVASILAEYSPIVEMASIDEAYLDLRGTERLHGPPVSAAHELVCDVFKRTGLPCSAGLARTRLVAKVASDQAKPRGLVWVPGGMEKTFLAPLPVRRVPGIGKTTEQSLRQLGIERVGQLAKLPSDLLEDVFGQWGTVLHRKALGEDSYEFLLDGDPKSISHSHTFTEDTRDSELLESLLSRLCQKAAKRVREADLSAQTVTLTIRYAGFQTITRTQTLREATHLDADFLNALRQLFARHWDRQRAVRLLGVGLNGFSREPHQLGLLDGPRQEKLERLARASDQLRDRFGFTKLQLASSLSGKPRR